jgi:hypothetical protein
VVESLRIDETRTIKLWDSVPIDIKNHWSRNSFKYKLRLHLGGKWNRLSSAKLKLKRIEETVLNRTRCDLIFRHHLFTHNFTNIDPSCHCGARLQSTKHVLLHCQPYYKTPARNFSGIWEISTISISFFSIHLTRQIQSILCYLDSMASQIRST